MLEIKSLNKNENEYSCHILNLHLSQIKRRWNLRTLIMSENMSKFYKRHLPRDSDDPSWARTRRKPSSDGNDQAWSANSLSSSEPRPGSTSLRPGCPSRLSAARGRPSGLAKTRSSQAPQRSAWRSGEPDQGVSWRSGSRTWKWEHHIKKKKSFKTMLLTVY